MSNLFKVSCWKSTILEHPVKGSLTFLGLLALSKSIYSAIQEFYRRLLRPTRALQERYGNCWALITDISDVVGEAYALSLGKKFNLLILHDEASPVDPEIVVDIMQSESKVVTIGVNYREGYGSESLKKIRDFFADKKLGLVILNQLNLTREPRISKKSSALEKSLFFQESIIFPLLLLRYLCPIMLRREKRGGIIALSHQYIPPSSSSLYEIVSKAFMEAFLRSLGAEYKGRLDTIHFEVGSVLGFKRITPMPLFALTAKETVNGQLAEIGYVKKGSGHWIHYLEKDIGKKFFNL